MRCLDFVWISVANNHPRMPKSISLRTLVRKLKRCGFDGPYIGSRHLFMAKGTLKVRIPNPHRGDISAALISEIVRQAGISHIEWDKN